MFVSVFLCFSIVKVVNMGDDTIRLNLRNKILAMEKPFCLSDLYYCMEMDGFTDRKMILQVLDELYEDGFIKYDRVNEIVDEPDSDIFWAFHVA